MRTSTLVTKGHCKTGSHPVCNLMLAAGLVLPAAANAQTWTGFYFDGAIGARSSSTNTTMTEVDSFSFPGGSFSDTTTNKQDWGKTNFLGEFSAGYRYAIPGSVVIGFGAFVDAAGNNAGKSSSNDVTFTSPGGSQTFSDSTKLQQTSRYGLSLDIAPDWRTQPYAKVSYAWSNFKVSSSTSDCDGNGTPWSWSASDKVSGWGFGGGVRHLQTDNLYFFAEVMWQDYGSKSKSANLTCPQAIPTGANSSGTGKIEPSNVVGVVGVGFKF